MTPTNTSEYDYYYSTETLPNDPIRNIPNDKRDSPADYATMASQAHCFTLSTSHASSMSREEVVSQTSYRLPSHDPSSEINPQLHYRTNFGKERGYKPRMTDTNIDKSYRIPPMSSSSSYVDRTSLNLSQRPQLRISPMNEVFTDYDNDLPFDQMNEMSVGQPIRVVSPCESDDGRDCHHSVPFDEFSLEPPARSVSPVQPKLQSAFREHQPAPVREDENSNWENSPEKPRYTQHIRSGGSFKMSAPRVTEPTPLPERQTNPWQKSLQQPVKYPIQHSLQHPAHHSQQQSSQVGAPELMQQSLQHPDLQTHNPHHFLVPYGSSQSTYQEHGQLQEQYNGTAYTASDNDHDENLRIVAPDEHHQDDFGNPQARSARISSYEEFRFSPNTLSTEEEIPGTPSQKDHYRGQKSLVPSQGRHVSPTRSLPDEDSLFDFTDDKVGGRILAHPDRPIVHPAMHIMMRNPIAFEGEDDTSLDEAYGANSAASSLQERAQQAWASRRANHSSLAKKNKGTTGQKSSGSVSVSFGKTDTVHHFEPDVQHGEEDEHEDNSFFSIGDRSLNSEYTKSIESEVEDVFKDILMIGSARNSRPGRRKLKFQPEVKRNLERRRVARERRRETARRANEKDIAARTVTKQEVQKSKPDEKEPLESGAISETGPGAKVTDLQQQGAEATEKTEVLEEVEEEAEVEGTEEYQPSEAEEPPNPLPIEYEPLTVLRSDDEISAASSKQILIGINEQKEERISVATKTIDQSMESGSNPNNGSVWQSEYVNFSSPFQYRKEMTSHGGGGCAKATQEVLNAEDPLHVMWDYVEGSFHIMGAALGFSEETNNDSSKKYFSEDDKPQKNDRAIARTKSVDGHITEEKNPASGPPESIKDLMDFAQGMILGQNSFDSKSVTQSIESSNSRANLSAPTLPLDQGDDPVLMELAKTAARSFHQLRGCHFDENAPINLYSDVQMSVVELNLPLGLIFLENDGGCWVTKVLPDGSANKSGGVEVGDQLTAINGTSAFRMKVDDICTMISLSDPDGIELAFLRYIGPFRVGQMVVEEGYEVEKPKSPNRQYHRKPQSGILRLGPSDASTIGSNSIISKGSQPQQQDSKQQQPKNKKMFRWFGKTKKKFQSKSK